MITSQLITRMSAAPIEHCETPAAGRATLTRRRVKSNTAGLPSPKPAVSAGGGPILQSSLHSPEGAAPAHKIHEIAEWLEAKALPVAGIVVFYLIALNAPSWAAKAAANATF